MIWEVPDELWTRLASLLVIAKPRKKSGRPAHDARPIFNGLIWLARTGSQWSQIPAQFGPTTTIHDRFSAWVEYGCLERAWAVRLKEYGEVIGIDWTWQSADGCLVKAPLGKRGLRCVGSHRKQPHRVRESRGKANPLDRRLREKVASRVWTVAGGEVREE